MIETTWWSDSIRRNHDIGWNVLDFINLGDFRELKMEYEGLQQGSGANADLAMQFSTDNGATFDATTGNYVTITDSPTAVIGVPILSAIPTVTSIAGQVEITNFNVAFPVCVQQRGGRLSNNTGQRNGPTYHTPLVGRNAIRLIWSGGATCAKNMGIILRTRK